MIIAIVFFTDDQASMNQFETIIPYFKKTKYVFDNYSVLESNEKYNNELFVFKTDVESINYDNLDKEIKKQTGIEPEIIVFVTKHQSKANINSLSCHTPGNWGVAEFGGKDSLLTFCPSDLLKEIYMSLKKNNDELKLNYEVILECTHHGPYLETLNIFFEIGSNVESWINKQAAQVNVKTLMEVLPNFKFLKNKNSAIGIGGLHHCPEFVKRIERNEILIGHVCPKYMLDNLNENVLEEAILKMQPKCTHILLDWKGINNKDLLMPLLDKIKSKYNLELIKTKNIKGKL